jgi:monoterpene epsilon-lactone hydrolase
VQSVRSQLVAFLLKHQRTTTPTTSSLPVARANLECAVRYLRMPQDVRIDHLALGDMAADLLRPTDERKDLAILYLHGGGYTMGSRATYRGLASRIALASRIRVLLPELRLAPEEPYPAALEDSHTAYRCLLESGISPEKAIFVGDSSGGALVVALALRLRAARQALPAAIVCISPWADLALTGESMQTCAKADPLCSLESSRFHAQQYLTGNDPRSPLISPIYADLCGLPPILIQVGEREILLSDAERLAERARQCECHVELEVWKGMWHVWHLFAAYVPESQQAIDRIGAFVLLHSQ